MSIIVVGGGAVVGRAVVGEERGDIVPPAPTRPPLRLAVWAIDPGGVRRGMLTAHACTVVPRDADLGTWTVTIDGRDELAARLGPGWRVLILDGAVSMSGPIISMEWTIESGALDLVLAGVDELHRLADRIIYPNPRRPITSQDVSHYKATGPSETLIRELAWRNAGTAALLARRSPRLVTAASQGRGTSVTISERFSNLLEVARAIARSGGTTFSAVDEDGTVLLRQRVPRDLSRRVRFTDLGGGLAAGSLGVEAPTVTAAIVAAQGEGADRQISEVLAEQDDWGRRIEVLKDRRDTADGGVVDEAGREAVAEGAATATASVDVTEMPGAVYGIDYELGDVVTAQLAEGVTVSEAVRSVEIAWDGHGRTVKLTLGDHPDKNEPAWVARVRDLATRLSRQEAA